MGIKQWWQKVKNEKKRKELIQAAQKLENKGSLSNSVDEEF